jgi:hypothetical protein
MRARKERVQVIYNSLLGASYLFQYLMIKHDAFFYRGSDCDAAQTRDTNMLHVGNAAKRISPKRHDAARVHNIQIANLIGNASSNCSSYNATSVSPRGFLSRAETLASIPSQYRSRPVYAQSRRSGDLKSVALPSSCRLRGCCRRSVRRGRAFSGEVA